MNEIKKEGSVFSVNIKPWATHPVAPHTEVTVGYDENGLTVHFVTDETNLRAEETRHLHYVHLDSCMEMFMQFDAERDERYINIEINPNGTVYCAVCYDRYRTEKIALEDVELLGIRTVIKEDGWEIFYTVPVSFIKKYIPTYRHGAGARMRGNFYKCGNETVHPHYACFANIETAEPDFHRPEYFVPFVLA